MFLFYTLMCRNHQGYKWKPCWSQIGTFQKPVPELFSKMVTLRVEESFKRKTLQLQSCREFHGKHSGHKIRLIPSPDGRVRPDLVRPKMGRRKSEKLYVTSRVCNTVNLHHKHHPNFTLKFFPFRIKVETLKLNRIQFLFK
jgi:hypothetical protein